MIQNLNFRRPLNMYFMITACVLTLICSLLMAVQWHEIKSSYQRQNMRFVQNLAVYTHKYLIGYEKMLDETIHQFAENSNGLITAQNDDNLRHWLFERYNAMPDVRSLVYTDRKGKFIRVPNVELSQTAQLTIDTRSQIWYVNAAKDDFDSAHYTHSQDIFYDGTQTLTISKSLVNGEDGEKVGVMAIRLNKKSSESILNSASSPLPGQTWIIDTKGQLVASEKGTLSLQTVAASAAKMHSNNASFYLSETKSWYFYSSIGNSGWVMVHEVSAQDMDKQIYGKSANVLYCLIFALMGLLFCWWTVRNALNALYIRIANSIRNGAIEQKAAEQLLYEEIHNSSAQQEAIKNEALTDGLTELKNRRAFDNDIEFHQQSPDVCVALIDIDNFKAINDTYGHATGDMVLKTVSDLGMRLRGLDNITLYRYGGEEIAVLFQGITPLDALGYLNRWRETCDQRQFREPHLHVTFSGGMCMKGELSIEEALERADSLLYDAKHSGKNRIMSDIA